MRKQSVIVSKEYDIKNIIDCVRQRLKKKNWRGPFNFFDSLNMNENDHTRFLLFLFKYQNTNGRYDIFYSFLNRFTKERFKINSSPTEVKIRFSPLYNDNNKHYFLDGLIIVKKKENVQDVASNSIKTEQTFIVELTDILKKYSIEYNKKHDDKSIQVKQSGLAEKERRR